MFIVPLEKFKEIEALNSVEKENFEIVSYDFLGNGILSEYDGVLGIDFFKEHKICIDFIKSELTIS